MFSLLLALQVLGSVVCHYDNTIKISPNRYTNDNARSKRVVYINGIEADDVKNHKENVRRSAVANDSIKRSVRSTNRAQNRMINKDKLADRLSPIANTTAANRWDITDILLNRDISAQVGPKSEPKRVGDRWDITDILLNRGKYDTNSSFGEPSEVSRMAVYLTPREWKKVSVSKASPSSVLNETGKFQKEDNKNNLRWYLEESENTGHPNLNSDDYSDFNVIEYLINDFLSKHPEAKKLHQNKRSRNRYRRFNLNPDLLQIEPPKDQIVLKARGFTTESQEVPMVPQGSTEDLSVQPQPFEFTPLTDEEHQCTKASDGIINENRAPREIKLFLENDQSTGMVHIDTRRVCQQSTGLTVKACDKIRPYVFLIPINHVEFDIMVLRIQHKKSAQVTISVSCSD